MLRTEAYVHDLLDGEALDFDEAGRVRRRTPWRAGRREGECLEYDEHGRVVGRILFVADRPVEAPRGPEAGGEKPAARPGWLARLFGSGE